MSEQNVNNPHDKFFKTMLQDRGAARAFLQEYLPGDVIELIQLDSLQVQSTSYVDDELKEYFTDMIFMVNMKKHDELYISILIEHKSYPDKFVSLQMLNYILKAYQSQIKESQSLKPVIPILYYHGKETWRAKSLYELIESYPMPLKKYTPHFDSIFVSLRDKEDIEILKVEHDVFRSLLIMQK